MFSCSFKICSDDHCSFRICAFRYLYLVELMYEVLEIGLILLVKILLLGNFLA